jgi:hypothetical protein
MFARAFPTGAYVRPTIVQRRDCRDPSPKKTFATLLADAAEHSSATAVTSRSKLPDYPYTRHGQVNYPWVRNTLRNLLDEVSR